ncbi:hypothetical protein HYH03_001185 [Edaphochlamys debaryana]|uniref:Laccase n=1 Tax=Edaphochlamys debaryana TaxID=47281 RepID=A0A835YHP1_9CHLO|nr:hypothetical protein HYH03_001185 [Edaphochlamys debaryana]|eukprot:KAG2501398.1 hypothetical protein HYH03_001185 [Edaphochlamys debaryana]
MRLDIALTLTLALLALAPGAQVADAARNRQPRPPKPPRSPKRPRPKPSAQPGGAQPFDTVDLGDVRGATYFIAADQVVWNFAPSGRNRCFAPVLAARFRLAPGVEVAGSGNYSMAQYRQYCDSSFRALKPRGPEWDHLGSLGPALYGTIGDVIRIVFRNNLPYAVNMAPTGGFLPYEHVNTSLEAAAVGGWRSAGPEPVAPGGTVIYLWKVTEAAGPAAASTVSSRLWLYRSSVDPVAHDNAGLVGPLLAVARGAAGADGRPADVDREVVSVFQVVRLSQVPGLQLPADPADRDADVFRPHAINGFVWCNAPPASLRLRVGQRVRWHVGSVGSSDGLHNFHWHGHVVELNGHHIDQFSGIPAATYSVNLTPLEPGDWLFHCHVNDHMDMGMAGLYSVVGSPAPEAGGGVERRHYIAAEEVEWDYLGGGAAEDACSTPAIPILSGHPGYPFISGPRASAGVSPPRFGTKVVKTLYVEYTDASFATPRARPPSEAYLGALGPLLRASVGDTLRVTFLNRAPFPATMHPHGMRYDKASEGTPYEDGTGRRMKADDAVQPGQSYEYVWKVTEFSGPGPSDPSSLLWMYHSHLDETGETNAGLVGGILVTAKGMARSPSDPRPSDVDTEIVALLTISDEAASSNFLTNLRRVDPAAAADPARVAELRGDPGFRASLRRYGINGYLYCHMPRPVLDSGMIARIHVMAVGSEGDAHTAHAGGLRFAAQGMAADSLQIGPGGMASADVVLGQPGTYELSCLVSDHTARGMRAAFVVGRGAGGLTTFPSGRTRTYFVQAEPIDWDYAPQGYVNCTHTDLAAAAAARLSHGPNTIGSRYRKAVYREYTDASFTTRAQAPPHQGLMGPTLMSEVGDSLHVVFRNALTDLPYYPVGLHPGGGLEDAGSDAACLEGRPIAAGETCTYRWLVPESAGPSRADANTAVYGYTSGGAAAPTAPSAGLAGLLVVGGRGQLEAQPEGGPPLPRGVDAVVSLYWQAVDETASPYLPANAAAAGLTEEAVLANQEAHVMRSINGYLYCNLPRPAVRTGSAVRWLMLAYGGEAQFHAPHFEGQVVTVDRMGWGTLPSLMPATARVADMLAGPVGTWLLYCDVHADYEAGMIAQFDVLP